MHFQQAVIRATNTQFPQQVPLFELKKEQGEVFSKQKQSLHTDYCFHIILKCSFSWHRKARFCKCTSHITVIPTRTMQRLSCFIQGIAGTATEHGEKNSRCSSEKTIVAFKQHLMPQRRQTADFLRDLSADSTCFNILMSFQVRSMYHHIDNIQLCRKANSSLLKRAYQECRKTTNKSVILSHPYA